jgi:hypothetical protein
VRSIGGSTANQNTERGTHANLIYERQLLKLQRQNKTYLDQLLTRGAVAVTVKHSVALTAAKLLPASYNFKQSLIRALSLQRHCHFNACLGVALFGIGEVQ